MVGAVAGAGFCILLMALTSRKITKAMIRNSMTGDLDKVPCLRATGAVGPSCAADAAQRFCRAGRLRRYEAPWIRTRQRGSACATHKRRPEAGWGSQGRGRSEPAPQAVPADQWDGQRLKSESRPAVSAYRPAGWPAQNALLWGHPK